MLGSKLLRAVVAGAAVVSFGFGQASTAASPPEGLGLLPGAASSYGQYVSDDGRTVLIVSFTPAGNPTHVIWTAEDGLQELTLPGHGYNSARFLSLDGSLVAGTSCISDPDPSCEAYIWTRDGGLQGLGFLPGDDWSTIQHTSDSRDSGVVAAESCAAHNSGGSCRYFIWTADGGKRELPRLPGKSFSSISEISRDGSVIVGESCNRDGPNAIDCEAYRLEVASNTIQSLGLVPGYSNSRVAGISADNAAISILAHSDAHSTYESAIWTSANGLQELGFLPNNTHSHPSRSVSSSGPTAVGTSSTGPNTPQRWYVWQAATGMVALPTLDTGDRVLWMSSDGSTLVGDDVLWTGPSWARHALRFSGDSWSQVTLATDSVVIGNSNDSVGNSRAFRWKAGDGLSALAMLSGYTQARPRDASSDGNLVAGIQCDNPCTHQEATVWHDSTSVEGLGFLVGHFWSEVYDISTTGNFAVGESCDESSCEAVLWRLGHDSDGDGISNPIDSAPELASNNFNDGAGTSGSVVDRAGLVLTIEDATSPDGVRVVVGAGSGQVTLDACGFIETVAAGSEAIITCGSVKLEVIEGAAQVLLDATGSAVSIPAGVTALVASNSDGTVLIQNVAGDGMLSVTVHGEQSTLGPNQSASYTVEYQFAGFFNPVDNPPVLNSAKGGGAIPVKFSLGGDHGLHVLASGYPKSQKIACDTSAPLDPVEETVAAAASSLSYDATADQYIYVWKTDKTWAGTCRQLTLKLNDSSAYAAHFKFK